MSKEWINICLFGLVSVLLGCTAEAPTTLPNGEPAWPALVSDLPTGDPVRGSALYNAEYGCAACHGSTEVEGSNAVGPWGGKFLASNESPKAGYTAAEYIYESMLNQDIYIAQDCPNGPCSGPPSTMPRSYPDRMYANGKDGQQEMADLMAYLLATDTFESNGNEIVYEE